MLDDIGTQMCLKIRHSPAPSSLAASIRDVGIRLMKRVSINTANGENIPGSIIDQRVFKSPNLSATIKLGTSVT